MPPPDGFTTASTSREFYRVITEAVADIVAHGFDSQARVDGWMERIRRAALATMTPQSEMERALNEAMRSIYRQQIDQGMILRRNPDVSRFTLERVKPRLRAELDRRIMASANLIRLNRQKAIEQTLQRFAGWSTSIPAGGSKVVDRQETKTDIRKALAQLPFAERRVLIDQGAKLSASLSEILAVDGGAIAGVWYSHFRQAGYDYREDHKERDGQVYMVRGNWAQDRGLCKVGSAGYTDQITAPASEPYCRCRYQWIYTVGKLPEDMLTARGRGELRRIREVA